MSKKFGNLLGFRIDDATVEWLKRAADREAQTLSAWMRAACLKETRRIERNARAAANTNKEME